MAEYKPANPVDFPAPQSATYDIRKIIADAAGWVEDVDNAIKVLTNWSPLEHMIKPISGNWNKLKRIGDAYKTAGDGIEKCGKISNRTRNASAKPGMEWLASHFKITREN